MMTEYTETVGDWQYEKGDGVNPRLLRRLPVLVPEDINVRFQFCFYLIFLQPDGYRHRW